MTPVPSNILISRTDSIGDAMLTLPVAGALKKHFPGIKIGFLGKAYTRPVIEACTHVDAFIEVGDFLKGPVKIGGEEPQVILHVFPVYTIALRARELGIPLRIGTTNRLYHWTTCNRLVKLGRKNSQLHEAQLNLKLLAPFGIPVDLTLEEIAPLYGLRPTEPLAPALSGMLREDAYKLILHPKSQGHAREWPLDYFICLIRQLDPDRYQIFISGTPKERESLQPLFDAVGDRVTDTTGMMTLPQFIAFIDACDGLVANSTGPLHIAAALGKDALGLYSPLRPIHPGRWAPIGPHAKAFVLDKDCTDCKGNRAACTCIRSIQPLLIREALDKATANKARPFDQFPF
jgi:heptosyltransferase-3